MVNPWLEVTAFVRSEIDSNVTSICLFYPDVNVTSLYESQANEMLHHKANLNGYLAYHTGQSLEKINQDTDRDYFMSPKEAKDYGLIDGVIMNPLKALQPLPAAADGNDKSGVWPTRVIIAINEMVICRVKLYLLLLAFSSFDCWNIDMYNTELKKDEFCCQFFTLSCNKTLEIYQIVATLVSYEHIDY